MLGIVAVVGWSGYSYWQEYNQQATRRAREMMSPTVGSSCSVVFRNAETGIDKANFGTARVNGTENFVSGKFVELNDEWIVLQGPNDGQLWIPREHVLLMRVDE